MSEHPITLHANHFSREKQVRFLEALSLWGSVRAACRAVPVSPQTVYRARRSSRDFALAWDAAVLVARPHVEDVLSDRALNGVEEAVFYHGEEVARRRRFDSRLLLAHLARLDKAEDRDEVREVAEGFDAALERLKRGEPVDPLVAEGDDEDQGDPQSWENENLPFVERVLLYLDSIKDEGEEGDDDDDDDDLPDPFAPEEDEESFDASEYIIRDRVTPVTLPDATERCAPAAEPLRDEASGEPGASDGGADLAVETGEGAGTGQRPPADMAAAAPAPDPAEAASEGPAVSVIRRRWEPIWDGRMSRFYGRY